MHRVQFGDEVLMAEEGTLLSHLLQQAGKHIEHPCGGNGSCGKCKVLVDGKEELSCKYRIHKDITVSTIDKGEMQSVSGIQESRVYTDRMCYALDIGTTTIALALVSLEEKKVVRIITKTNPQRAFGADIMNRIQYCQEHSQVPLHKAIVEVLEQMVAQMQVSKPLPMLVAANVTMLHLLFDEDCTGIGVAPYTPVFLEERSVPSFIKGVSSLQCLPSIHSFVGADIVAGMHAVGFPKEGKYNLLVDLGTNAEVALFSRQGGLCTAAAAGPCFEGANISCGMSATKGAISMVLQAGGQLQYRTIEDAEPKGICGTGLIDAVAELLRMEEIDETGFLECESYPLTKDVTLTAADVRQFQLAKSAICSAIVALMHEAGIDYEDIDGFYISGGFSSKINLSNAVAVGLFPRELLQKCQAIHNSSLAGCVEGVLTKTDYSVYVKGMRYVDLSANALFGSLFVENMMFE